MLIILTSEGQQEGPFHENYFSLLVHHCLELPHKMESCLMSLLLLDGILQYQYHHTHEFVSCPMCVVFV